MAISEDHLHSHLLINVYQWICHNLLKRHMCVAAGVRTPNLLLFELLASYYNKYMFI